MPHARLMPNVPKTSQFNGLNYHLDKAREIADQHGSAPAAFDFSLPGVENRVMGLGDHSVMFDRDDQHRAGVRDNLIALLGEAIARDYNVAAQPVFKALFFVAIEQESADYIPMRVMGSTVEAIKNIPK